MDKKIFSLLVALMALSLLGIICIQWYWISNSYDNKETQFMYAHIIHDEGLGTATYLRLFYLGGKQRVVYNADGSFLKHENHVPLKF